MPTVRDTINPLNEREVSEEEALDLDRMGLLLKNPNRAKRPDTLLAVATRQVVEQLEGTATVPTTAPAVVIGVGDPADDPIVDDEDEDDQDPGAPPVSTTDDTPNSNQES
ncbi:hypothetical protein [Blastococcus sp. CT_GayMR16]|uniref:hypothetical protein n=1 Tax=Blastococcus sp. CT_GayMR16 TaxID=2559607 RepID=UPI0010746C27|nr:hypothetical protein [Blastococcus sp. CT_GayMR16]TFV90389.1 hypothetical protein E4P38_02815 [Blastococcus sp. CT_GayMR16]